MSAAQVANRKFSADLIEATPAANGLLHWILASPAILFIGWLWVDIFAYYSPIPSYTVDILLGLTLYVILVLLMGGYIAFMSITALPNLFRHAGWDVSPLEEIPEAQQYTAQYDYQQRHRAKTNVSRIIMRAGQGWVYIEMALIFIGAIAMIPIFFSVSEFGFGR